MSSDVARVERSSDALRTLIASGVGATGRLDHVRPFRMSTLEEMLLTRHLMMGTSGLLPHQFAENPWGFPFIPIPENRSSDPKRLIQAPANVTWNDDENWSMIGHPIYWIDPALTAPTEDEQQDIARWGVRMFYLIMALGLWDDGLNWYDAPITAGVPYARVDFENYRAGHSSQLDKVRYGARDLLVPYERVLQSTAQALEKMADTQLREFSRFSAQQASAFADAQTLMQTDRWDDVDQRIGALSAQLAKRARDNETTHELVAPIFEAKNDLVDLLNDMERTTIMLSAANYRDQTVDSLAYSRIMSALDTYTQRIVDGGYERALGDRISELFENAVDNATAARNFAKLHEKATAFHHDAWRRLKLSAVNHARRMKGEPPFNSYVEMEAYEAAYPTAVDHFGTQNNNDVPDEDFLNRLLDGDDF